ncbi:MAG: S8/S53 family peptidase [Asgard group archaeon]|nr:S8/S53 family peptidase [Asgard group archaeon]
MFSNSIQLKHTTMNCEDFNITKRNALFCTGTYEIGGDGEPDNAIDWININEAFTSYSWLKNNHGNYKLAILDTGLDEGTFVYFRNKYSSSLLNLRLFNANGQEVQPYDAIDYVSEFHHGTFVTSIIIQLLERDSHNVNAQIDVYVIADSDGDFDEDIMYDQLNRIKTWNTQNPNNRYKVITTAYRDSKTSEPSYTSLINQLVSNQNCIFIAASGNYVYGDLEHGTDPDDENWGSYPSKLPKVIGAGGIYGYNVPTEYSSKKINRMTVQSAFRKPEFKTGGYWLGSCYKHNAPLSTAGVELAAPGFKIEGFMDKDGLEGVENYIATGTSLSAPQVAVAAYLAARAKYYLDSSDPLTYDDFYAAIVQSSENDPSGRYKSTYDKIRHEKVGIPTANLGTYTTYFSYRVGYGSLDVHDMIEFITDLS